MKTPGVDGISDIKIPFSREFVKAYDMDNDEIDCVCSRLLSSAGHGGSHKTSAISSYRWSGVSCVMLYTARATRRSEETLLTGVSPEEANCIIHRVLPFPPGRPDPPLTSFRGHRFGTSVAPSGTSSIIKYLNSACRGIHAEYRGDHRISLQ